MSIGWMCKIAWCILGTESTVVASCYSLGCGAELGVWPYLILLLLVCISYFLTRPRATLGMSSLFPFLFPVASGAYMEC